MLQSPQTPVKVSIGIANLAYPEFFMDFHKEENLSWLKNAILLDSNGKLDINLNYLNITDTSLK
jgi:hypothetical protein